ncbi:hypothetical protein H6F61_24075 [Cyanobacteria bacterium FACHB-472]|nr:hypothetical protein [Cyanobacteria bacterium FACHB-472]
MHYQEQKDQGIRFWADAPVEKQLNFMNIDRANLRLMCGSSGEKLEFGERSQKVLFIA